ncbi:MAG: phenylalanine--tRNA ligase subunit beta, partial [Actinomycetota bacterium]|nr:phenylalanine--tRNA ligase subunit beta [Actinomycetota bacterium]
MNILKSWLNDWIDLIEVENEIISDALESLGFEIENFNSLSPDYKNIVVGKVVELYQHPNADKVRVTKVDVGSNIYEIVCGAWNFDVGAIVPVALPKSYIKNNFLIDKRDIRGVVSNGMICSASELGLWDDHSGILLLDQNVSVGADFSTIYDSKDALWEINVTPNRGDCMSHLGVARELSNYFKKELKYPNFNFKPKLNPLLKVNSGKTTLCNSYDSVEIEDIVIQESGFETKYRLSNIGVRVINNVVDYTNYVLHDIGQPLHAFDRDKLFGTISVRLAKPDEKIVTLDSQTRTLEKSDLVITDNDKPIALAGVMGGLETEVTDNTKNLLIESAYFDKVSIMKTSRRLNLISDASVRFERGIDFNLQTYALKRFINLFKADQEIQYTEIVSHLKNNIDNQDVTFEIDEINKILGISINEDFILETLNYLNIECSLNKKTLKFKQPSWRYDLERPIDMIEELAKHYGFNNFPATLPIGNNLNDVGEYWKIRKEIVKRLTSNNFHELQTLSFADKNENDYFTPEKESVSLLNPIDKTQENLRTSLFSSLINSY